MPANPVPRTRPRRIDGEQSRARLMQVALQRFAHKGFANTSTREIAEAAGTNLAAIGYYFGDKAGLYRAVFFDRQATPEVDFARLAASDMPLRDALRGLYLGFLEPLKQGDQAKLCMKLHMREMLEPTGMWEQAVQQDIRPMHEALLALLCRQLGLGRPDDDVKRLAVCLTAMGVHMHVGRDITDMLAPALNRGTRSLDLWLDRLVTYGEAMVRAEADRRAAAHTEPPARKRARPSRT